MTHTYQQLIYPKQSTTKLYGIPSLHNLPSTIFILPLIYTPPLYTSLSSSYSFQDKTPKSRAETNWHTQTNNLEILNNWTTLLIIFHPIVVLLLFLLYYMTVFGSFRGKILTLRDLRYKGFSIFLKTLLYKCFPSSKSSLVWTFTVNNIVRGY